EPRTSEGDCRPEKYATTGLPIFLKALLDAGATRGNLNAWIAGGALVGPLEKYDLDLDIGGHTAERVMEFLADQDINVEKSETGGFFTCAMLLNMQAWECRIEPAGIESMPADADSSEHRLAPADINRAMETLQPIPQVALKLLRLINEDNYDIATLTDEIRKDQVLGSRTLKLCNSVFIGSREKIESLDHALVYLGQTLLIKFVISASINNFFLQAARGYSLCKGGIYHHAIGTAVIAEKIAEWSQKASPMAAYTAGLLHDIGKVVLDQYIHSALPMFYRELQQEKKNFIEVEKDLLGMDHTEAGAHLARKWSFPDSLTESISHHHNPEDSNHNRELVHMVYLADLLMSRFHTGLEIERLNTHALTSRLETLGLSKQAFTEIVDIIPLKVLAASPEIALLEN
ncbi:MAG: HDOD domain-containing protein, partial [Deltaproteobacteria bacterium]|nr:HDOD domain-containing protein [Deltaproteobacteria bacterium]